MEINSDNDYYMRMLWITGVLAVLLIGTLLWTKADHVISVVFFSLIEVGIVFERFTHRVKVDDTTMRVNYYRFFMDKELTIPLNQIELKILKTGNYRGISYVLEIQQKNKKVYTINSTDGYEKEEFEELAAYCNNITGHA